MCSRHNPAAKRAEKAAEATNTASSAAAMAAQDSDDSYTYKCDARFSPAQTHITVKAVINGSSQSAVEPAHHCALPTCMMTLRQLTSRLEASRVSADPGPAICRQACASGS